VPLRQLRQSLRPFLGRSTTLLRARLAVKESGQLAIRKAPSRRSIESRVLETNRSVQFLRSTFNVTLKDLPRLREWAQFFRSTRTRVHRDIFTDLTHVSANKPLWDYGKSPAVLLQKLEHSIFDVVVATTSKRQYGQWRASESNHSQYSLRP
jgi:hypothetical protein